MFSKRATLVPARFYWDLNGTDEYLLDITERTMGIANQWSILISATLGNVGAAEQYLLEASGGSNFSTIRVFWASSQTFTVINFSSTGATIKTYEWDTSVFANNGDAAHIVITFDGDTAGDPLLLYKNGAEVAPTTKVQDNTGTMTDESRSIILGLLWNGNIQDVAVFPTVLSAANAVTLYGQRNDADPMSGFSPTIHFTPQDADDMGKNYGSGNAFDVMLDASNITSGDDRIQGNLIP